MMSKSYNLGSGISAYVDPKGSEGDRIKVAVMRSHGLPLVRDENGLLDISALATVKRAA